MASWTAEAPGVVERLLKENAPEVRSLARFLRRRNPALVLAAARGRGGLAALYAKHLLEARLLWPVLPLALPLFALYGARPKAPFPSLLLAIAIVTVIGPGLINTQLAIGVVAIPIYARVMRASVLSLRDREFVSASRALGASETSILFRKVLPNALTPIIVQGTLGIGGAILDDAALSSLGLGAQPPTAEWGSMIGADRNLLFSSPHVVIFPGIAITMTVLAFNLVGDGLRDALDPRDR